MATYQLADNATHRLCQEVLDRREPDLKEAALTFQVMFAYGGEDGDPPLKAAGYALVSKTKINELKLRVAGLPDVTILVDGDQWEEWGERRREAVLAHALHHLAVRRDGEGKIKLDDVGRPKLRIRLHDFQVGIFTTILEDYGADSVDHEQLRPLLDYTEQKVFPWG